MANALNVIFPYKYEGLWGFDDDSVDLVQEPFVEGADTMIDVILEEKVIGNADQGIRLIFSSGEFPRYDVRFDWVREGEGGNWYRSETHQMEGWLCPALLRYFESAPQEIYARFEQK